MDGHGKALLDGAEEVLEVGDVELRMQAALHQDGGTLQVEGLLDLRVDLLLRENEGFGSTGRAVEGAEPASGDAHVCVVYVAVDDESGQRPRDGALARFVRASAHPQQVARTQQLQSLGVGHARHRLATSSMKRSSGTSANSPAS